MAYPPIFPAEKPTTTTAAPTTSTANTTSATQSTTTAASTNASDTTNSSATNNSSTENRKKRSISMSTGYNYINVEVASHIIIKYDVIVFFVCKC